MKKQKNVTALRSLLEGKYEGGFNVLPTKQLHVRGGLNEPANNCSGGYCYPSNNCAANCGNCTVGCGSKA